MNTFQSYINERLEREARLRLFLPIHQNDFSNWYRASGGSKCNLCGLEYRLHPYSEEFVNFLGEKEDHRICNGDIVHL